LKDDAINFMSNVSIRCKTIKCFAEIVLPFWYRNNTPYIYKLHHV
jgi:hypothetical protein